MKIGHKLFLGFSSVLLLVLAIGGICIYQLREIAKPLDKDLPETIRAVNEQSYLNGLAQLIRYYDEVLTQSARNYAFTQDKKWQERYRETEPKLDAIIKEAIAKDKDAKDKQFFSNIDKANTKHD